jgi:hypothetical protein
MQEVNQMSTQREQLHNFVDTIPEMYVEKALLVLNALVQPTGGEIETENMKRWWKENIASKPHVPLDLSPEELKAIQEDEVVSWDDFEKDCDKDD